MRGVVQRMSRGRVTARRQRTGQAEAGLFVLLGIADEDRETQVRWMVEKVIKLRLFEDAGGKMNRSLLEVGGELLVVSQFTLYGDARKGRRPSYNRAASPERAEPLYRRFLEIAAEQVPVAEGSFGDHMEIELILDGPVTILLDSEK